MDQGIKEKGNKGIVGKQGRSPIHVDTLGDRPN